jgi:hypothetical protein
MRVHHPLPGIDIDVSPAARFWGYPPAAAPRGFIAGDDTSHRFITALDGFPQRWTDSPTAGGSVRWRGASASRR